jgi:hypothetical protein
MDDGKGNRTGSRERERERENEREREREREHGVIEKEIDKERSVVIQITISQRIYKYDKYGHTGRQ